MNNNKNLKLQNTLKLSLGPFLSIVSFIVAYYIDPLNFASKYETVAIPAFLFSIVILLVFLYYNLNSIISVTLDSSIQTREAVKNYLHVTRLGTPEIALKYILSRLPSLIEVQNTSFNIDVEIERANEKYYETNLYKESMKEISASCSKGLLWKDVGDRYGLERFRFINDSTNNFSIPNSNYKYRILTHGNTQLNFIILEYEDGNKEVLFNWDYRKAGCDPIVLISRDEHIIDMFSAQYHHLWRSASNDHDNVAIISTSVK